MPHTVATPNGSYIDTTLEHSRVGLARRRDLDVLRHARVKFVAMLDEQIAEGACGALDDVGLHDVHSCERLLLRERKTVIPLLEARRAIQNVGSASFDGYVE